MALIDPCLSLTSFDPRDQTNANHPGDEREVVTNDEEAEPLSPASISKSLTAPSTPLLSSHNPSNPHSNNHSSSVPPTSQLSTLPTVLQSVFSYIFTDASGQQRTSLVTSVNSSHPSHNVISLPSTPTSSRLSPALPLTETARSLSAPPAHLSFHSNVPSTPSSSSYSTQSTENEFELSEIHEDDSDNAYECQTPVQEGEGTKDEADESLYTATIPPPVPVPRSCAILDLDETLLHSFFPDKVTPDQYQLMVSKCREQEDAQTNGLMAANERTLYRVDVGDGTIVVLMLRPFLRKFLNELFEQYDVGVWSAGGKLYVEAICRVLFPAEGKLKPLFQLCWDDVQIDIPSTYSYTKPLTTISKFFPQYELPYIFLIDNRKDNGFYFPSQLVVAPDYLPHPWDPTDKSENDCWLDEEAMQDCERIVHQMPFDQTHKKRKGSILPMDHSHIVDDEGEVGTTFYMEDIDMNVEEHSIYLDHNQILSHSD
jgi:hypothetical protein